jgi:threonine/homoserine/homoserine lactone efflux protein
MSEKENFPKREVATEPFILKTILWIGVGLLAYFGIQWMLPKMGVSS